MFAGVSRYAAQIASLWVVALFSGCLASDVATRTDSAASGARRPLAPDVFEIVNVREGYATLGWEPHPEATEYHLIDAQDRVVYTGAASSAFVSGLPDGDFEFRVRAFDDGRPLADGPQAITVRVAHWPLGGALVLFMVGLTVVTAVLMVIIRGSMQESKDSFLVPSPGGRK